MLESNHSNWKIAMHNIRSCAYNSLTDDKWGKIMKNIVVEEISAESQFYLTVKIRLESKKLHFEASVQLMTLEEAMRKLM
jgi:hypothetical protein